MQVTCAPGEPREFRDAGQHLSARDTQAKLAGHMTHGVQYRLPQSDRSAKQSHG